MLSVAIRRCNRRPRRTPGPVDIAARRCQILDAVAPRPLVRSHSVALIALVGITQGCVSVQDHGSRADAACDGCSASPFGIDAGNPLDLLPTDAVWFGDYQPFLPATRFFQRFDGVVSTTDLVGPLACESIAAAPNGSGTASARVFTHFSFGVSDCPVGQYAVRDWIGCRSYPVMFGGSLSSSCGFYERRDDAGNVVARLLATGGGVEISVTSGACTVEIDLAFGDHSTFHDAFSFAAPGGFDSEVCVE
jgi:hypothetical protein